MGRKVRYSFEDMLMGMEKKISLIMTSLIILVMAFGVWGCTFYLCSGHPVVRSLLISLEFVFFINILFQLGKAWEELTRDEE
jgi:hypothetical protein